MLKLSQVLSEEKRKDHFADSCCHFNEEGTQALSAILADYIIAEMRGL